MGACSQIEFEKFVYPSRSALARAYGVSPNLFKQRLTIQKWTVRQALNLDPIPRKVTDECVGSIYRITHIASGRCYIGLTTKPVDKRFKEHIHSALVKRRMNRLAVALRKYGPDAFLVTTIARSKSRKKLAALEVKFITKFGSNVNGYNTHKGGNLGSPSGKSIEYNNVVYESVSAFCRAMKIDMRVFNKRRSKGWSMDACVRGQKRICGNAIRVNYNGVTYDSLHEFCDAMGHPIRNFESRAYRGWDLQRNLNYVVGL